MTKWAAVIGSPIDHSLSPALHRKAFELLGLDWEYQKIEVTPDELTSFVQDLDGECVGLSVTAPLKRDLLALADAVDGMARLTEAGNTLAVAAGMKTVFNTDVHGIVETVQPHIVPLADRMARTLAVLQDTPSQVGPLAGLDAPVILGTGATAASALAAVKSLGATKAYVVGRNFSGTHNPFVIANEIGLDLHTVLWRVTDRYLDVFERAPLVISTVPPAVTADLASRLKPDSGAVLLDVTYSAGHTPLEKAFATTGAKVTSPLEMLTIQGIAQVKIWTSQDVPFDPVYDAVLRAANRR